MHLLSIRIAGFKSFADPVTIHIPKALSGIVGPNGSGKSNVIDAMRWVVGESSAKSLRGGTLDDVIFNGSAQRKPAGQASVELLFDNTLSRCNGQWEKYAEISIRRTVTRDGISEYFINGTRARRRDVKELFLGTGFGPRSYSIIEQGMISRIVEGKPEDLSTFIEEASGVSRFREKRHETQLKLKRVAENLERLDDMRHEIEKRIRQLKYQADQARRYKNQKEKLNALRIQLLAYEWREAKQRVDALQREKSDLELVLEQRTASARSIEADLEGTRQLRLDLESQLTDVQMELFRVNAEVADCDRRIKESTEQLERARTDIQTIEQRLDETNQSMTVQRERARRADAEYARIQQLTRELQDDLNSKQTQLGREESRLGELQSEAEQLEQRVIQAVRGRESASAALQQNRRTLESVSDELRTVNTETSQLELTVAVKTDESAGDVVEQTAQACERLRAQINQLESNLAKQRRQTDRYATELDQLRENAREVQVQLGTLERLLAASAAEVDDSFASWLVENNLNDTKALYLSVEVADGWDRAVDRVLGEKLSGICVSNLFEIAESVGDRAFSKPHYFVAGASNGTKPGGNSLVRFVRSPDRIAESLLGGVYTAESVSAAMAMREQLGSHECVVTTDGAMVGVNWYSPAIDNEGPTGMLEVANRVRELRQKVVELDAIETEKKRRITDSRVASGELERELDDKRQQLMDHLAALEQARVEQNSREVQHLQAVTRLQELVAQQQQLQQTRTSLEQDLAQLHLAFESECAELTTMEAQKTQHSAQTKTQMQQVKTLQDAVNEVVRERHYLELEAQRIDADRQLANSSLADLAQRREELDAQKTTLEAKLAIADEPAESVQHQLAQFIDQRKTAESELATIRDQIEAAESERRQLDEQRLQIQLGVEETNLALQEQNAQFGRLLAQSEEIKQKLAERRADAETASNKLDEQFDYEQMRQKFEKLDRRITNTGSVNLVAVEQYEQEMERKSYMDAQHEDLTRALETLQQTIRKIDKESRERYIETFSIVNSEFQILLPRLFGGGSGHLELTGDYPENAGLRIFARPKGKRIHNIQALSGGEKALTAVALILSFFQLNPSPVCLLDEIDAPLDDENVFRLCDSLHALSNTTQLILITHNKITMESVDTLIGVTMPEPNVSRVLSVDLLEAQEFAA